MLIYKVENQVNGKVYIGMTTLTLDERMKEHFKKFKAGERKQVLYNAFRKYGWENFKWTPICCVWDKRHLADLERYFIKEYNSFEEGYNMTVGGDGVINGEYEKFYLIRFPDGKNRVVKGMKRFCREYDLNEGSLYNTLNGSKRRYTKKDGTVSVYNKRPKKHHKGFKLLGRFNDYPEREYTQAGGKGGHPVSRDEDIVSSTGKLVAA